MLLSVHENCFSLALFIIGEQKLSNKHFKHMLTLHAIVQIVWIRYRVNDNLSCHINVDLSGGNKCGNKSVFWTWIKQLFLSFDKL